MAFLGIHYHLLGPFGEIHRIWEGFPGGSVVKGPPAVQKMQETRARSRGREGPREEGMATHSSIRAWRTPWTEEPGGLQSIRSQRVGYESEVTEHTVQELHCRDFPGPVVKALHFQCRGLGFNPWVGKIPWRKAWQPAPVFLPGEPHGQRSLVATIHWVAKSQTQLK